MAIPEAFWYARVHTTVLKEAQLPKIWANRPSSGLAGSNVLPITENDL
jgi:hypothetical protein